MIIQFNPTSSAPLEFFESLIIKEDYEALEQAIYDINLNFEVYKDSKKRIITVDITTNEGYSTEDLRVGKEIADTLNQQKTLLFTAIDNGVQGCKAVETKRSYITRHITYLLRLLETNNSSSKYRNIALRVDEILLECLKDLNSKFEEYFTAELDQKVQTAIRRSELKAKSNVLTFNYPNIKRDSYIISEALKDLKDGRFVDIKTQSRNLLQVFGYEHLSKPIIWTGKLNALTYFIKKLINIYPTLCAKQQHWFVTANCFVDKNAMPLTNEKLKRQPPPVDTTELDKILSGI